MSQSIRIRSLVLDFDSTITVQDTLNVLADAGLDFQRRRGIRVSPGWQDIVDAYVRDHAEYTSTYRPIAAERRSFDQEVEFLRGLREVEHRSIRRVGSSQLFYGMGQDAFFSTGQEAVKSGRVRLREGFAELMALAAQRSWLVSVLSVNWSTSFIRGVLCDFDINRVVANEVQLDGKIAGPVDEHSYHEDAVLSTCLDKGKALRALTEHQGTDMEEVIYFGDSLSDIECLLHARGVVVSDRPESNLLQTLRRLGHRAPALGLAGPGDRLAWGASFADMLESRFLHEASSPT